MNSLQPLMTLLEQSERERDEAWADAQRAVQAQQAAQAQAEQLLTYRREYEQRWSAQFRTEARIELLHCYRGFMDRLTQAVDQQGHIAAHAGTQADRARAKLAEHEMRVASVRKLIERRSHELRLAADRQEQKQTDEFASRAGWGRSGTAHGNAADSGLPHAA